MAPPFIGRCYYHQKSKEKWTHLPAVGIFHQPVSEPHFYLPISLVNYSMAWYFRRVSPPAIDDHCLKKNSIYTTLNIGLVMILSHPCRCLTSMVSSRLKTIEANGLSSEKLALTICIGSAMGILPFPWVTTLLCFLLAYLFRLNQIALQSLNYLLYPLQLVLLVPYCRLGAWLFPWGPQQVQDISVTLLYSHFTTAINMFGWIIIKAIAAWLITAPPAAVILYLVLILVIKKKASFSERQIS